MSDSSIGLVPVFNVEHVERSGGAPMTAPPPYTAQHEGDEYESLLELHERQELAAVQPPPNLNADIDLEAAHAASDTSPATTPAPKPPLTLEQLRVSRVHPLDNVRAFCLCLLILQNAAIQAVSMHPDASQLHETSPKMLAFVNQFVGMTRLLVVPVLFFVSGVSSQWAMSFHDGTPVRFVFRKTLKTTLTVALFQGAAHLSKHIHPLPLGEASSAVPYYASREGIEALLNGPTYYVLAILALDYIYAFSRFIVLFVYGHTRSTFFVSTINRYKFVKYTLFLGVELYIIFFSMVVVRRPLSPVITRWMYALNSAELHFPLLYLGAYIAGVKFITYFKFLIATAPKSKFIWLNAGFTLFIRVAISFIALYLIYRNNPETMPPFLDVRMKPALALVPAGMGELLEEGILLMYGAWVGYTLLAIPEAIIIAFWSIQALGTPRTKFARHAHIQVYMQLIFVIGNRVPLFDNIFVRWAYLGLTTMFCAHYLGVGGAMVGGLTKRGWNALRGSRRTSTDAAPEGALSL